MSWHTTAYTHAHTHTPTQSTKTVSSKNLCDSRRYWRQENTWACSKGLFEKSNLRSEIWDGSHMWSSLIREHTPIQYQGKTVQCAKGRHTTSGVQFYTPKKFCTLYTNMHNTMHSIYRVLFSLCMSFRISYDYRVSKQQYITQNIWTLKCKWKHNYIWSPTVVSWNILDSNDVLQCVCNPIMYGLNVKAEIGHTHCMHINMNM